MVRKPRGHTGDQSIKCRAGIHNPTWQKQVPYPQEGYIKKHGYCTRCGRKLVETEWMEGRKPKGLTP